MKFIKGAIPSNTVNIEQGSCTASAVAAFLGVAASFFSFKCGMLDTLIFIDNYFSVLLAEILILPLIAVCGFCILGVPIAVALDFVFGAIAAMLACVYLDFSSLSAEFLVWSALLYLLTASVLIISSVSCGLSRLLLARVCADRKLKRSIAASLFVSFGLILVIVSVLILVFRFNPEIYI